MDSATDGVRRLKRCIVTLLGFVVLAPPSLAAERSEAQRSPPTAAQRPATAKAPVQRPTEPRSKPIDLLDADELDPGVGASPAQDQPGATPPEYKQPNRWSLTAGGSQRKDWLTGRNRWVWGERLNARRVLGMPEWLNGTLEHRTRYETFDVPWRRGQTGGEHQIPLQTVLWIEAHHAGFRAGFEFWDARQFGAQADYTLNNSMVNVADFTQLYAAWSTPDLLDTGLGFEIKGGRQTLDLGSRRLVARNAFRNTVNAFTGLMARIRDGDGDWQVLAFATHPVLRLPDEKSELLNNDWAWDQEQGNKLFAGVFAETAALPWDLRGELYCYYLNEDPSSDFPDGNPGLAGSRRLFTPGFRVFWPARKGLRDFEIESGAQTGNSRATAIARELDHEAFLEHLHLGYTFDLPWEPRLLVQYDYATGGQGAGTNRSFDTLYGARRFDFGPTGIFGPFSRNNINAPGTRLLFIPHRDLTGFVAYRAWWMANARASWQPAGLIDPTGKSGDFLGHTVEFSMRWDARDNVSLEAGWNTLIKGTFARNAPDAPTNRDNVNYFYVQTMVRF
ncbi:alginate export family protein [Methylolobus aquaticus]